ncbi:MAG: hypothetical protein ABSE73_31770, partial [Planctomycetota bacterium]
PLLTPPTSLAITNATLNGKFLFNSSKPDSVAFKGTLELPAGFNLVNAHDCWVGLSGVTDKVSVSPSGKAASHGLKGLLKAFKIAYPRRTMLATTGQTAVISFTLYGPNLSARGFAASGIAPQLRPDEGGQDATLRYIQAAIVLDTTAYSGLIPVEFALSKTKVSATIKPLSNR